MCSIGAARAVAAAEVRSPADVNRGSLVDRCGDRLDPRLAHDDLFMWSATDVTAASPGGIDPTPARRNRIGTSAQRPNDAGPALRPTRGHHADRVSAPSRLKTPPRWVSMSSPTRRETR